MIEINISYSFLLGFLLMWSALMMLVIITLIELGEEE